MQAMLNKYYYLVSSLPYLKLGQENFINKEAFLLECKKWLSVKDIKVLSKVSLEDFSVMSGDTPVLQEWKEFDFALRTELASARNSIKRNRNEKPGPMVKSVLEEATPFLMEQVLARIRWERLDSMEAGNFFDLNFLMLYFLKLQIIERLKLFDKGRGEKVFQGICEVKYE